MAFAHEFARDASNKSSLIEKAKALHQLLSGEAPRADAQGRLTDETIAALRDNGFLGLWLPRSAAIVSSVNLP